MNDNLLTLIQQALGGDFSRLLTQFLGESQASTQSALGLLVPVVLGSIAQKGATPQGASSLMSLINGANLDTGSLANLAGLFSGGGAGANALMKSAGVNPVAELFGGKGGALASALASSSGVKPASATNLLAVVVPLILAFLKKFIGEKSLDANSLSSLLVAQGPHLKNSLDSRLTSALGFPNPGAMLGELGGQVSGAAKGAVAGGAATVANKSGMAWLPWVVAAVVLALLWYLLSGRSPQTPEVATPAATTLPAPATPAVSTSLPAKIYFDVGAAAIGPDGSNTIARLANAINSEGMSVAVTGYTDKSGDIAMNEDLARNRVIAVVDALKAAGVAEASIRMDPPMFVETGASDGTDAEARRVEITRQ